MYEYQKHETYFAQIADGIEEIGAAELAELGASEIRPIHRGIHFRADRAALYRINYCTRLCTRVLAPLQRFACPDANALYHAARRVDWSRFFNPDQTFAVFAATAGSSVPHSQFAALKVKDAVADRFRADFGRRPNVDARAPDLWINLHIHKDRATLSVDTSGGSLHRRGYRLRSGDAPMQETVAAAMLRLSGWDGGAPLADPMCGSGTLIIEAAMAVCRTPAAILRRSFGFAGLPDYDPHLWNSVKEGADRMVRRLPERLIYGSDIDGNAVAMARDNCRQIPHGRKINILRKDFTAIDQLADHVILCNPPYGIRMKGQGSLDDLYRRLGDFLKQRCRGATAYIYFGNREMIKCIGLKPSWKKPLRNGGLDGRLVKYEMY